MRRTTVVAMGLLCLIALKPSSLVAEEKSVESAKADSGLRFLESGKGQSGVGVPSAVRAAAATSHASGLTASRPSKRLIDSFQVPAPAAPAAAAPLRKKLHPMSYVIAFAGAAALAVMGASAITGVALPTAVTVLAVGALIVAATGIGYGMGARDERAARRAD